MFLIDFFSKKVPPKNEFDVIFAYFSSKLSGLLSAMAFEEVVFVFWKFFEWEHAC